MLHTRLLTLPVMAKSWLKTFKRAAGGRWMA
jgi:hypothetical protein